MINKLKLVNFQNHENSEAEFCSGMNVLRGESRNGKSAIIRALNWLCTNKPVKNSYRKKETDFTSVAVDLPEGHVERTKMDSENAYIVNEEVFKAFKSEIPSSVEETLNISPFNIQKQFDDFFLIGDTPGEAASKLNEIAGLDVIDKSHKAINSIITKTKSKLEYAENDLKEMKDKHNELKDVDIWAEKVKKLSEDVEKMKSLEKQIDEIKGLYVESEQLTELISELKFFLQIEAPYQEIESSINDMENLTSDIRQVKNDLILFGRIDEDIELTEGWLSVEDAYNKISDLINEHITLVKEYSELQNLFIDHNSLVKHEQSLVILIAEKEDEYSSVLAENGHCPLCGEVYERNSDSCSKKCR